MRLRLNISTVFLAYIFNISVPTASRYITDVVSIVFIRMQPLILWPEREQLQKTMPMQCRKSCGTKASVTRYQIPFVSDSFLYQIRLSVTWCLAIRYTFHWLSGTKSALL